MEKLTKEEIYQLYLESEAKRKEEEAKRKEEEAKRKEEEVKRKEEELKRKKADSKSNALILEAFKRNANTAVSSTKDLLRNCNIEKIETFDFLFDTSQRFEKDLVEELKKVEENYNEAIKLLEIAKALPVTEKKFEADFVHPFIHAVLYPVSKVLSTDYFGEGINKIIPELKSSFSLELSKRPDAAFCKRFSLPKIPGLVRLTEDSQIILPVEGKKVIRIPTSEGNEEQKSSKSQKSNTDAFWDAVRYCSSFVVSKLEVPKEHYTIFMDDAHEISVCKVEPEISDENGKITYHIFHSSKRWKINNLTLDQFKEICFVINTAFQKNQNYQVKYSFKE